MKQELKIDIIPKSFKMQWHITERCNFRCLHCYQDNYNEPDMPLDKVEEVLKEFVDLLLKWKIPRNRSYLTITGGEPFLYDNFYSFLGRVYKYSSYYQWAILSNGSLVNREAIKILKLFKISSYQISIEGLEKNNDKIRGSGNFKKAFEAINTLIKEGIDCIVSLTITKENVHDVIPLANLLAKLGVRVFWVRRLVPLGQGIRLIETLLEPLELLEIYKKIEKTNQKFLKKGFITMIPPGCDNAFLWENTTARECCAVMRGEAFTLLPSGDVLPCRRLPIKIGNIYENSFWEIYYSEKMKEIRDLRNAPEFCIRNCEKFIKCLGGAKCVTYAYSRRMNIPDIQCPRAFSKLDKNLIKNYD